MNKSCVKNCLNLPKIAINQKSLFEWKMCFKIFFKIFGWNLTKAVSLNLQLYLFPAVLEGLTDVIVYQLAADSTKNRGFCFLEYEDHKAASAAKKKLGTRGLRIFNCEIIVDWADAEENVDDEVMETVSFTTSFL